MLAGGEVLKREIGYNPTRFNQMVVDHGGPHAVRALLKGPGTSGFATLYEHQRLEMSAEAAVLLPWYESLFTPEERAIARWRLEQHRFDVDAYLARRSQNPPAWAKEASEERDGRGGNASPTAPHVAGGPRRDVDVS
jgi:hypothetical protein